MALLAAIEGQLVFLVIAGIIGLVNWLTNRNKTEEESQAPSPQSRRPVHSDEDAEAERTRKFFEALGVPEAARRPRKRTVASNPAQPPPPLPKPVRRVIEEVPVLRRGLPQEPEGETRPPALAIPISRLTEISALPAIGAQLTEPDAYHSTAVVHHPEQDPRAFLRSPRDVRAAMLLREILGPPKSLQP